MEQSEDIADLLADVAPLTDAEFDALAVADLATEAGQAPAGRQTAGQETGVGHGQRLVTRARRHRTYDLRNVPNAVALVKPLPRPGEVQKAKELKSLALTVAEWAKRKNMGEEAIQHCRSYALEAERKMGQMLKETERADGGDAQRTRLRHVTESPPTLSALGLTKRESAEAQMQARGATLTSSRNHAKVIGLAFERDAYVVEGSANMRSCNNLEQFTLTNDPELFEFHRRWIQSI